MILGILFCLLGVYTIINGGQISRGGAEGLSILLLGIIFIAAWWFTRKYAVSVKPNGGSSLDCLFEATSNNAIQTFLNLLEQAKTDRINQLHSNSNIQTPTQRIVQSPTASYIPQCPSCKSAIKQNDIFCENCGCKLK